MGTKEVADVEILNICGTDIKEHNSVICLEENGFLLCKQGSISLVMDDNIYNVHKGDLYIYPAFSHTYIQNCSDDLQGVIGKADFDFILSSLDSIANTQSHVYIRFHPLVTLTTIQYQCIEKLIEGIRNRQEINTKLKDKIVIALVQALCYEVIDAFITNSDDKMHTKKQTRRDKIFQNFIVDLHHNFRNHRNVKFYADRQNITPRYFATLVREVSGKTPLQWICLFVISEAKKLLSNPNTSVKEVANILNFSEQSFFGQYFRQYVGCSPSEYKERINT